MTLASTYMQGRSIPQANLLALPLMSHLWTYTISQPDIQTQMFTPIKAAITLLAASGTRIDFIVLMYGTPYIVNTGTLNNYSVDGILTQVNGSFPTRSMPNPYLHATTAFSSSTYHMVMVTRLDGRSTADVASLISQSLRSDGTKPNGEFFFDYDPTRETSGYQSFNTEMIKADETLAKEGRYSNMDKTTAFVAPTPKLAGYASWGSNDGHFSQTAFNALKFVPGAIAETAVSTAAQMIRQPGGFQSQIADLEHQGVTGAMGDVSEPQLWAIPDPSYVFQAYTTGSNLAESFYSGLSTIVWKEVILGDPLCAPYV